MNFQEFQQSRRKRAAKYDENNILTNVGVFSVHSTDVEQWCHINGTDYCPSEDLECVFFYGETGLYIEKLCDGSYLLNIENESISADLESLELALYHFACGECYFDSELQEQEIIRFYMIEQCKKIDPNGTYSDFHCIREGLRPMDLYEACRQFVKLTTPDLVVEKGAKK